MPCVCLVNTFARWQSLKASKPAVSQANAIVEKPEPTPKTTFASNKTLRVPHTRPSYSAAAPEQATETTYRPSVRMTRADLINAESKLGSMLFGPIPAGHRREFFHDQKNIWIWHEDWYDGQHNSHQMTIRYEVRTSGVYKKVSTGKYFKLEGEELENFRRATHAYLHVIKKNLYNRQPHLIKMPTTA